MAKNLILIIALALLVTLPAAAQSDDDFDNELSYGINLNSNGGLLGGAFVRKSWFFKESFYQLAGLEIVEIKHPKENRLYHPNSGDNFIAGKQNHFFSVRPHYGLEHVLFRKAAESGVQVNAVVAGGPSLGLLVPYYIRYDYGGGFGGDVRTEAYDPNKHLSFENTLGSSNVFTGLGETNVNFGLHAKMGLSFEYGRYRESITGIEVGFMLEQFFKEMVMIPQTENYSTFTSVYLNIYYGRRK
ncbi:hypothetical protein [uncultured Pontibacter sp.]|uniref:hypothetical protein n=1 Tax=uncultured Pontibacter sp. TaxID=453356 RepID=UPI002622956D|nr:hypothetical protein [uncultured Pontibacter sp.]